MHFGYDRVDFGFLNIDNIPANGTDLTNTTAYALNTGVTTPLGLPNIYISPFGGQGYLGTNQNRPQSSSPNPYYDFSDSISILKGKHSFKFGGEFIHAEADSTVYSSGRGQIYFNGGLTPGLTDCDGASCGLQDFYAGNVTRGVLLSGNPNIQARMMSTSGFIQDDYRATSRLIINLGLRYEYNTPFSAANNAFGSFNPALGMVQQGSAGLPSLWQPDHRGFEPRLGFAWDITGKGTTVVRGGASVMDSSFVLFTYMAEFSLQNNSATSIAAVPTGAILQTGTCQVNNSCPTAGGTIQLGTANFPGSALNWKANSPTNPLFPSPIAKCGDGNAYTGTPLGSTTPQNYTNASPCSIMGVDPNLRNPYIVNYNLSITHAFTPNISWEVGYVGNKGYDLLGFRDINQPNVAAGSYVQPYAAQFPYLNYINYASNQAHSMYNSLQTTLTQRMTHGLSYTVGYTYAHGLDNGSLNRFGLLPQNSYDPNAEYASSDFDIRHRLTVTATYNIPGIKGYAQMLEGWQINVIGNYQTPQPWTVSDSSFNFSGTNENADRWDFFGNPSDFQSGPQTIPFCQVVGGAPTCSYSSLNGPINYSASQSSTMYNQCTTHATGVSPAAYPGSVKTQAGALASAGCYVSGNSVMIPTTPGTFGTMGRNLFRDTGFHSMDFSLFKNFSWKERYGAQFRFEVFNVFNSPTFSNPYGASNAYLGGIDPSGPSAFGYSGATPDVAAGNPLIGSGANRDIQIGLKLTF